MEHTGFQFPMKQLDQSKQIDLQHWRIYITAYKQESFCPGIAISLFIIDFLFLICIYFLKKEKKNVYMYAIVPLLFPKYGTTSVLELTPFLAFYGLWTMVFLFWMRKRKSLKILLQLNQIILVENC